jgi:riboflavin transporter FmnP
LFCKKHKYDLAYTLFFSTGDEQLQRLDTKKLALATILGALAAALEAIPGPPFDIRFPLYPQISWDPSGIPMMISVLFTGSIGGIYTCLIGCAVIMLRGNLFGGILKLVAELATLLAFVVFRKGIVKKSVTAIVSRVLVMTVANYLLLPIFYAPYQTQATVVGLLVPIAIFNITQALINIIPAYIVYSRLGDKWLLFGTADNRP